MGVTRETFYDRSKIAILPMGFCFPGTGRSGDLPPRAECADAWRQPLLDSLERLQLTLIIGQYAARWHLGTRHGSLTNTVKAWREHGEDQFPLPHPSPRNNIWLKRNPWFETDVLPDLRRRVRLALA